MKISRAWLQRYFEKELPSAEEIGNALTFHAFEIDGIENDILDVKVTPNRGHDCLSHRGIAKEISAILKIPMKADPLRADVAIVPATNAVSVGIDDPLCSRYVAGYIRGVKVGPSPDWLRIHLESIGQKSINNVVDATNFVMFDLGQPLHAFDAGKLQSNNMEVKPQYSIGVRMARTGESLVALGEKKYALTDSMLVVVDKNTDQPIGIAGVKGGMPASITESTTDIIIESANFNGVSVRKTAQSLKLRTDASSRFEQVISPELAAYGMRAVVDLIVEIACPEHSRGAGGEVVGFADSYPTKQQQVSVSVDTKRINAILGSTLSDTDVADALARLNLEFTKSGETFVIEPPLERLDILIPEDVAEEVGRIIGYDTIRPAELPLLDKAGVNAHFYAAEKAREELVAQGYSEVFTSVFADAGERIVANKVDGVTPYMRTTLIAGLKDAMKKNEHNKDLLGLVEVKLFEIGVVWKGGQEITLLGRADEKGVQEAPLGDVSATEYDVLPLSQTERYQPFSKYPFVVRDIAIWVPNGTEPVEVLKILESHAGELLVRSELFDTFKKTERTSLAFRLVFQSFDRTLTDFDVNERMESITKVLKEKGFEIR